MDIGKEGNRCMHEVAVMQGVVKTILQSLSQAGASRVTNVQLAIGRSGHFTEENAQQHFEVLTKDTPAEGASLTISWLPATLQCLSCFHRFSSSERAEQTRCPKCGDMVMEIEHQDICYVSAIDVISEED
jgi:hydrogenase nickel incorporation protein HypA/HybF